MGLQRSGGLRWDAVGLLNNALDQRKGRNRRWRLTAIRIDKLCRAVFPLAFIFFNIIYWYARLRSDCLPTNSHRCCRPYYLWFS